MTKRQPASRSASSAGITPGSRANFSTASIWKSGGSAISVPSRSTKRIFRSAIEFLQDLQQRVVLPRQADGDAQAALQPRLRPAVADEDAFRLEGAEGSVLAL